MKIESIQAAFPDLKMPDADWADLANLTEMEERDFPVAMGQVRLGLFVMANAELEASVIALLPFVPLPVQKVARDVLVRCAERTKVAISPRSDK